MVKPITLEMVEAMSLDQRKTLHANALKRDTQAAKDVIALLAGDDLMSKPSTKAVDLMSPAKAKKTRSAPKVEPSKDEEEMISED